MRDERYKIKKSTEVARKMKHNVATQIRKQMLKQGKSDEEIERVLNAYYDYRRENNALLSNLLGQEKRNRFSCVNEKETATMSILYEEDC